MPQAVGLAWAGFGFAAFVGFFGPLMRPPQWVYNVSPFEHIGRMPLADVTAPPVLILTAIAAVLVAAGLSGFRRRDLETR